MLGSADHSLLNCGVEGNSIQIYGKTFGFYLREVARLIARTTLLKF